MGSRLEIHRDDSVVLRVTHSNIKSFNADTHFSLQMTVESVKEKLWKKCGTSVGSMSLELYDDTGNQVALLSDNLRPLGFYSPQDGYRLHVVDLDPSSVTSGGWLEDTSLVEKYKISEEAYDKLDGSDAPVSEVKGGFDAGRIQEVKGWLSSQFESAGKDVPDFEYTPRSIAHFHDLATISKAKTQAAVIVANDFRQKAIEYRSQAARIREILEGVGLAQENLPVNVASSAQVLANVANLLNIRDTEMSSFLVAMGDISLRKTGVEEKKAKVEKESRILLDYTRKAIQRLSYLKRILAQLEDEVAPCEAQMENWKTNLSVMISKEREYNQRYVNYKALLNRVGYTPEISHGMLVEMAEHRKELEKKTKPILDTLRSYQDLPPDKALAALAIEDKKRQYAAAEKYLEEVLQSALGTS